MSCYDGAFGMERNKVAVKAVIASDLCAKSVVRDLLRPPESSMGTPGILQPYLPIGVGFQLFDGDLKIAVAAV